MSSQIPKSHIRLERDIAVYEWLHLVPWKAPKILSRSSGSSPPPQIFELLSSWDSQPSCLTCAPPFYSPTRDNHHGKVQSRIQAAWVPLQWKLWGSFSISSFVTWEWTQHPHCMVLLPQRWSHSKAAVLITKKYMAWEVLQGRESSDEQTFTFDCRVCFWERLMNYLWS